MIEVAEEELNRLEIKPRLTILFLQLNPEKKDYEFIAKRMVFERKGIGDDNLVKWEVKERKPVDIRGQEKEGEQVRVLPLEESPETFSAIVITGSPYIAYEKAGTKERLVAWQRELRDFIKAAMEHNVPILGICYGEQILAEVLGGKAERMRDKEGREVWELGFSKVHRTAGSVDDPVLRGLPAELVVAQNHKDTVSGLPEGARLLLENEYGVQGFRIGEAWGFQFHPEREVSTVEDYIASRTEIIQKAGLDPEKLLENRNEYSGAASRILSNFLDHVCSQR